MEVSMAAKKVVDMSWKNGSQILTIEGGTFVRLDSNEARPNIRTGDHVELHGNAALTLLKGEHPTIPLSWRSVSQETPDVL